MGNDKQPDYMKWLPPATTAAIARCEFFDNLPPETLEIQSRLWKKLKTHY